MRIVNTVKGYVLGIAHRNSGSSTDNNGKEFSWTEADILYFLQFQETKEVQKLVIDDDAVAEIQQVLEDVCWGAFVEITMSDRKVSRVKVLDDCLEEIYDNMSR